MNILMICDEYPPGKHGGIGTAVQLQAREMAAQGHKVIVAGFYHRGYGGADEFEDNGVKVFRFRQKTASDFFSRYESLIVRAATRALTVSRVFQWDIALSLKQYGKFLNKLIHEYAIDIAEIPDYHDYMRFCYKPVYFPAIDVPYVVKLHGSMTYFDTEAGNSTPPHITQMEKKILHDAAAVAGVSRYTADVTAKLFDYHKEISVIHNGINMPEAEDDIKKKAGAVTFTGSLVEKKGIFQLMKAWNIVAAKVPEARLYIYGKGKVQQAKELLDDKAGETAFFMGHTPRKELMKKLRGSEVAVFPSYAECFALGPIEAMACGTAVVYSTRTSGPELINDGVNGLLTDPDNVPQIAEVIIKLLNNKSLNRELAAAGKQHIIDNLSISTIARQNINWYTSILQTYAQR